MIKVGIVSVKENGKLNLEFKEIENTLNSYYKELDCDWIDMPFVSNFYSKIGVDIMIDDEGKLKSDNVVTAIITSEEGEIIDYICGSYILCSHNKEGETISLNEAQEDIIKRTFKILPIGLTSLCNEVTIIPF